VNALVLEALENVGLAHTLNMRPSELSGGMKKRIALARTLILKPEVILYDEPTTGLDPITGREISNLMRDLARKYQTSSIVISHDLNCVKIIADRVVMLIDGKCYKDGSLDALSRSDDSKIKAFFE
jgi:phospholipid/cholesterol/gamma-HCH transport system ATP-binding protein